MAVSVANVQPLLSPTRLSSHVHKGSGLQCMCENSFRR